MSAETVVKKMFGELLFQNCLLQVKVEELEAQKNAAQEHPVSADGANGRADTEENMGRS